MKRRLGTVLDLLHPDLFEDRKRKNEKFLYQRLSMCQLRSFSPNDAVYSKNHSSGQTWIPGTVIEKTGTLSYKTVTPDGKSIRCHIYLSCAHSTGSVTVMVSGTGAQGGVLSHLSNEKPKNSIDKFSIFPRKFNYSCVFFSDIVQRKYST
ncbi:hypothetical protein AVEN_194162-1 [Araneus ventricosus]|uniref:Uncharacterized protein n=1 Tax=Araneus ventricosus TaxID=182803 RepID=A0A4Y2SIZ4_ARAVE|nr:hypothetical protein AVEN_194162-1 [Araneus ventricosus]